MIQTCFNQINNYLLFFKKNGDSEVPVTHPTGTVILKQYLGHKTLMRRTNKGGWIPYF